MPITMLAVCCRMSYVTRVAALAVAAVRMETYCETLCMKMLIHNCSRGM